jgi:hypothetical protein
MPLSSRTAALRSVNAHAGRPNSYWVASRAPRYSFVFALPLLVLYEALAAVLSSGGTGIRNGADVLLKRPFELLAGQYGAIAFGLTAITLCVILIVRDMRRSGRQLRGGVFAWMLAESAVLAVACGVVVGVATTQLLGALGGLATAADASSATALALSPVEGMGLATRLMVSLGAGLYEELLFRVVLVSAIAFVARRALGMSVVGAGIVAAVLGALVFSGFHYIGEYGDPFTVQSFVFRALAGLFFSALYLLRGFGIAAWTHALYDVMILVL